MARLDPLVGGPHDEVHKSARPGPTVKRLFIHELNFIIGAFNEIEQRIPPWQRLVKGTVPFHCQIHVIGTESAILRITQGLYVRIRSTGAPTPRSEGLIAIPPLFHSLISPTN